MSDLDELLDASLRHVRDWLDSLDDRPVAPTESHDELLRAFPSDLPDDGEDPVAVIDGLAAAAEPGLVASTGPRYFGFVLGGSVPAALGADLLTSAWDQMAGLYVSSPAMSIVEELAGRWVLELIGLPRDAGVGFTTGATMANLTCLAAARSAVLDRVGWDVEAKGLIGAPPVRVILGDEVHATVPYALRLLGFGAQTAVRVPVDGQGTMRADALRDVLETDRGRPTIVAAQAGNVNTGAFDPFGAIVAAARDAGAWVHVDGAFGFWAAASRELRHLTAGMELADSWTTDAHKWLNVPYDCGIAIVRDARWQQRAMSMSAAYLLAADRERDPYDWVPDASRRARGATVYAALRSLGRRGIAELIERDCRLARRFADALRSGPGVRILNDVVLNQVLVRFDDAADPQNVAAGDARTRSIIAAVQRDGTMWAGGTTWHGLAAMRLSVSNWRTTDEDIDRSAAAILRAAGTAAAARVTPAAVTPA
jgi:glutamate/tyrosine decarboxylase-like PLP-dependent enzyme